MQQHVADFHKVGGYRILVPMLSSHHPDYRAAAANLIAVLAQNNPYGQKVILFCVYTFDLFHMFVLCIEFFQWSDVSLAKLTERISRNTYGGEKSSCDVGM